MDFYIPVMDMIFAAIPLAFFIAGLLMLRYDNRIGKEGIRVTGLVVGRQTRPGGRYLHIFSQVEFVAADGSVITTVCRGAFKIGGPIDLYYFSHRPKVIYPANIFGERLFRKYAMTMIAFGIVVFVIATLPYMIIAHL